MDESLQLLNQADPEMGASIERELNRQRTTLELIPSENIVSAAVMAAQGSVLTNKYAEGYPGKRYYGGCEYVDEVEQLAIERVQKLFGAEYANVQPHSGSQANMATYFALLQPQDGILGMDLSCGGHLTHGARVNFSGILYRTIAYGVDQKTYRINMDEVRKLAHEHKPKLIIAGASSYSRIIPFDQFAQIANEVNAHLMVDMAHIAGLVAANLHPSPIPYADVVTSTTHKTLRGPRGGLILAKEKWKSALNSKIFPGIQGGPLMHVIAAKAIAFHEAARPEFKEYQRAIVDNAQTLSETLQSEGIPIISGGTDNHLLVADIRQFGITGKAAEVMLDSVGITVNKNSIPFDPAGPTVTSGIRLGTPAVTSRGLKREHMQWLGKLIGKVLRNPEGDMRQAIRNEVAELCQQFPLER